MLTGAWLLALLMAGAPLAVMAGGGNEEDKDAEACDAAEAEAQEHAEHDLSAAEEDAPPPTDYEFILGSGGDHTVMDFRPGTDTLSLTSDTWDFDLFELESRGGGAALEILQGEGRSVLRFPGLDALPTDDIFLHIAAPAADVEFIALRDALDPEDEDVLVPADPDEPDDAPDDPSLGRPLRPTDPDAPEDVPPAPTDGEPLAPTDPDRPEDGGAR